MTTSTKRGYKLQEFVAHSLSVNCLKIGRKSSRVLVTGGEDHKVNLWAIGKPNSLLSLSGHTSGIDSVGFDSSEALVAAGAANGTIKLWDLEEAKIIRTLTGHRSNCISLDFHPFGEFFASGSLDTNLKIWDIRRKGCIHTYKGHTRGINAIRFTPDGRWVVSGGEDNSVKLWDLTAGKLLHEFKCHDGQIECIDFHPHEFLLATGSADKTVKFWDLETFELIGSAGPESTGVRCMTFNPDGRTLLCGLHESLKVFSWEPIRSHDTVDVGWSKLSDMNVHEGKLLGCSYNQSCVGVWVVDISQIEPYAKGSTVVSNGDVGPKSSSRGISVMREDNVKANLGRLSISNNSDNTKETRSSGKLSVQKNSEVASDSKSVTSTISVPSTPQRTNLAVASKTSQSSSSLVADATNSRRQAAKFQPNTNASVFNRSDVIPVIVPRSNTRVEQATDNSPDVIPVIVPRSNTRVEQATESRKEEVLVKSIPQSLQAKASDVRKFTCARDNTDSSNAATQPDSEIPRSMVLTVSDRSIGPTIQSSTFGTTAAERKAKDDKPVLTRRVDTNATATNDDLARYQHENYESRGGITNSDSHHVESQRGGRMHSVVSNFETKDRSSYHQGVSRKLNARGYYFPEQNESVSVSDEDTIADLMEPHDQFVGSMRSRLNKLQVVLSFWERRDIKGALSASSKMADNSVLADVVSLIAEKTDMITLDICSYLMPPLSELIGSDMDRHLEVALDMLLKLVRAFGSLIYSSINAPSSVGVDIEAEQRLERCNLCYVELEKIKRCLPNLFRRGGSIAKSAQELDLALQQVS